MSDITFKNNTVYWGGYYFKFKRPTKLDLFLRKFKKRKFKFYVQTKQIISGLIDSGLEKSANNGNACIKIFQTDDGVINIRLRDSKTGIIFKDFVRCDRVEGGNSDPHRLFREIAQKEK